MEYFKINVADLDSVEFRGATPIQHSAWLVLMRYCAGQENDGRILDAATWNARRWSHVVGLQRKVIMAESPLWWFDGNDLVVRFYPLQSQEAYHAKSDNARKAVEARWRAYRARKAATAAHTSVDTPAHTSVDTPAHTSVDTPVIPTPHYTKPDYTIPSQTIPHHHKAGVVIPPVEEVIEASRCYPGSTPLGTSAGSMPKSYVENWYRWQLARTAGFPANWFRVLVFDFERDYKARKPIALGQSENKTGGTSFAFEGDLLATMRAAATPQPPQNP